MPDCRTLQVITSMAINAGETENKGIDLTINSTNIMTKEFYLEYFCNLIAQ